jgi:predicted RNA-binding protein with EMAP domain
LKKIDHDRRIDHIREVKRDLSDIKKSMDSDIDFLEKTPRHRESMESSRLKSLEFQRAKIIKCIKHIRIFLGEIKDLNSKS